MSVTMHDPLIVHFMENMTVSRSYNTCSPCRAKLASLFGLDQEASQGNESFQYTAPKQPRKSSNSGNGGTSDFRFGRDVDAELNMSFVCLQHQPPRNQLYHLELLQCYLPQQSKPSDSEHPVSKILKPL